MELEVRVNKSDLNCLNMWENPQLGLGYQFPNVSSAQRFIGNKLNSGVLLGSALLYFKIRDRKVKRPFVAYGCKHCSNVIIGPPVLKDYYNKVGYYCRNEDCNELLWTS